MDESCNENNIDDSSKETAKLQAGALRPTENLKSDQSSVPFEKERAISRPQKSARNFSGDRPRVVSGNVGTVSTLQHQSRTPQAYRGLQLNKTFARNDGICYVEQMPAEILLMVFAFLPKRILSNGCLVSRRWYKLISKDERLWRRMDLAQKKLGIDVIHNLINRGLQVLRLAKVEFLDVPSFKKKIEAADDELTNELLEPCCLEYLDLSMVVAHDVWAVSSILLRCNYLVCLSLEFLHLDELCCEAIAENVLLTKLNMAMCEGLNGDLMATAIRKLEGLKELNIAWCQLKAADVRKTVENVPKKLQRLNFSGCRKSTMSDDDIIELCERCGFLKELDLSDCTDITSKSIEYVISLPRLKVLSLSRCYNIDPHDYVRMDDLKELNIFGTLNEAGLKSVTRSLEGVKVNGSLYSTIARPTTGIRRTSIWEVRTRDDC